MADLMMINARMIDGTGADVKDGVTVTVRDGRIANVRASGADQRDNGEETIDIEGRVLLPGLINAHCHVMMNAGPDPLGYLQTTLPTVTVLAGAKRCEQMLRAGITSARDLGGHEWGELALRDAFAA